MDNEVLFYEGKKLMNKHEEGVTILTTEEDKMYTLFLLKEGEIIPLDFFENYDKSGMLFDYWYDHCVNPFFVKNLVEELGLKISDETFKEIVKTFNCNYLDIDNNTQTSYYGSRVFIKSEPNSKYFDVEYKDPFKDKKIKITFEGLHRLNEWLESIHSPKYEELGIY